MTDLAKKKIVNNVEGIVLKDKSNIISEDGTRIVDLTSEQLREYSSILRRRSDTDTIHQCEIIYFVYNNAEYTKWDNPYTGEKYKTFEEYAKYELGKSEPVARQHMYIWAYFGLEVSPKVLNKFKEFGVSKLKELIDVVNDENMDEWYEKAKNMKISELSLACREELMKKDGEKVEEVEEKIKKEREKRASNQKTFLAKLDPDQMDLVKDAIERAGEISGKDNRSELLYFIAHDFVSTNMFKDGGGTTKALVEYFKKMESILSSVKLIVVNSRSGDIVYGKETLDLSKDQ
jgi:hypothetical protein